jgi:hypothetical protein
MATRVSKSAERNGKAPSQTGADGTGRLPDGRFAVGNKLSKGNPFSRRLAGMRTALLDAVGEDQLKRVVTKMVDLAAAGDVAAATLLFQYAVGRPTRAVNPDTLDLAELRLLLRAPDITDLAGPTRVAPDVAVFEVLRQLIKTPEKLLESLQARLVELIREARGKAGPAEYVELHELLESVGLGDDDEDDD